MKSTLARLHCQPLPPRTSGQIMQIKPAPVPPNEAQCCIFVIDIDLELLRIVHRITVLVIRSLINIHIF